MYLQILQMDELRSVQLFRPICGAEKRKKKSKTPNINVFSTLSE